MDRFEFLSVSMKSFKTTGTVAPSSRFLCNGMTRSLPVNKDIVIVELGAGNGVLTKRILQKITPNSKLISFEIEPKFCKLLHNIADSRLSIIEKSADQLSLVLQKMGISEVDAVISSLPFVILPEQLTKEVLKQSQRVLKKDGTFTQMHYSSHKKKNYLPYFGNCHRRFVPLNVPPAWVYSCKK